MQAKVTEAFKGCRDGQLRPEQFEVGDTIEGKLAAAMVAAKKAEATADDSPDPGAVWIPGDWAESLNGHQKIALARELTGGAFKGKAVDAEAVIRAELARSAA